MLLPCFTVVVQIHEGDSSDVAAIAGGVCGAVGFLIIVVIVIVVVWKKRCAYIRLIDKFIYVRVCVWGGGEGCMCA